MDLVLRQAAIQEKLRTALQVYQQLQAQLNGAQQEIYKLQGQLELLAELQAQEARRAQDGDNQRAASGPGADTLRLTDVSPNPPS